MSELISIVISLVALIVSIITAWLTLFQKGELRMTQPTVIFFGPDSGRPDRKPRSKVFLRTLLYSTAHQGQIVESLHVNLQRSESKQNFSIWVYGDDRLARGSGLFVPAEGIVCNHHFLLPEDTTDFRFVAGDYVLRVYAKKVGSATPKELATIRLHISESNAKALKDQDAGIYFDWGPDQQAYQTYIDTRPHKMLSDLLPNEPG